MTAVGMEIRKMKRKHYWLMASRAGVLACCTGIGTTAACLIIPEVLKGGSNGTCRAPPPHGSARRRNALDC